MRVAKADDPALAFSPLAAARARPRIRSGASEGRWISSTNWQAKNFRIVEAPAVSVADRSTWRDLVPHRDDAFIEGFDVFRDFLAVDERSGGLHNVRIPFVANRREFSVTADRTGIRNLSRVQRRTRYEPGALCVTRR